MRLDKLMKQTIIPIILISLLSTTVLADKSIINTEDNGALNGEVTTPVDTEDGTVIGKETNEIVRIFGEDKTGIRELENGEVKLYLKDITSSITEGYKVNSLDVAIIDTKTKLPIKTRLIDMSKTQADFIDLNLREVEEMTMTDRYVLGVSLLVEPIIGGEVVRVNEDKGFQVIKEFEFFKSNPPKVTFPIVGGEDTIGIWVNKEEYRIEGIKVNNEIGDLTVKGVVSHEDGTTTTIDLTVNKTTGEVPYEAPLKIGKNEVKVKAYNQYGSETLVTVKILHLDTQAPLVKVSK